jgi:hypothetical protein
MVLMKNIIMIVGLFIIISNIFPNISTIFGLNNKVKEGIQSANPPPKGCSASQRNIATQQAGEIDNLESRVLSFGAQLKLLEQQIKKQKDDIGANDLKITQLVQRGADGEFQNQISPSKSKAGVPPENIV